MSATPDLNWPPDQSVVSAISAPAARSWPIGITPHARQSLVRGYTAETNSSPARTARLGGFVAMGDGVLIYFGYPQPTHGLRNALLIGRNDLAFITKDQEMRRRFPPRLLKGVGPGLYWDPLITGARG